MKLLLIFYPVNHLFSLHGSFLGNWLFHSTFQLWDWCLFTLFGNRFYLCCFPISFWMPVCVPFLKNKESQDFLFIYVFVYSGLRWAFAALAGLPLVNGDGSCAVAVWRLPVEAASLVEHSSRHTVFSGCRGQALERGLRTPRQVESS